MLSTALKFQKPLEDYIEYFDKLTPRLVPLLDRIADVGMAFEGPLQSTRGSGAFQDILKKRFEVYTEGRYDVQDFVWGRRPQTAYMRWVFTFQTAGKLLKKPVQDKVAGMVEVGFSPEGKVCSHIEYWQNSRIFETKAFTPD